MYKSLLKEKKIKRWKIEQEGKNVSKVDSCKGTTEGSKIESVKGVMGEFN